LTNSILLYSYIHNGANKPYTRSAMRPLSSDLYKIYDIHILTAAAAPKTNPDTAMGNDCKPKGV
jgi:hypothetical protein